MQQYIISGISTVQKISCGFSGVFHRYVRGRLETRMQIGSVYNTMELLEGGPHNNINQLVSWSLTSLFSTNMAISETKHQPESPQSA